MAHVNGHAGHGASEDHSLSVFLQDAQVETSGEDIQTEDRDSRPEVARREDGGVPRKDEWTRVSSLAIKHLDRCVSLEPKVLHGNDPDAIHDLRVATRRLQQVVGLIYPSPRSGEVRKLYRGLKRCRGSLSEIRNYDVLLERVEGALSRKRTSRREAWEAIGSYLRELRSVRLEKSLRKLAKTNLSAIYVRLKDCLPSNGKSSGVAAKPDRNGAWEGLTSEQFYERISNALEAVWAELEQEIAQSHHQHDAAVLHRTRIAAKRVRYLIEVIHAFDVPGSKETLIWLRNLQTRLGNWHDLVVFEEAVIGMIADRDLLRDQLEMAIQIERLIMRNRVSKSNLEKQYFEMIRNKAGFIRARDWVREMVDSPAGQFARS
jgi:CHAD domain-containing protein